MLYHAAVCRYVLSQQFWGSNLAGVREAPIDFGTDKLNSKLVYSAHIYGKLSFYFITAIIKCLFDLTCSCYNYVYVVVRWCVRTSRTACMQHSCSDAI
jgi:hypothetical protein